MHERDLSDELRRTIMMYRRRKTLLALFFLVLFLVGASAFVLLLQSQYAEQTPMGLSVVLMVAFLLSNSIHYLIGYARWRWG
jgi:hypothetical protein